VGDAVGDKLEVTCWHERSNKSDFNLQKKKIINLTFKTQRKRQKRKRKEEKEKGEREGEKKERRGGGLFSHSRQYLVGVRKLSRTSNRGRA
jgi:hypothetical protein